MATINEVNFFDATIVGGVLDLSQGSGVYDVETEGGAATDTITSVTGVDADDPGVYELRVATAGHYWAIDHNPAGGLRLSYGLGFQTVNEDDVIVLRTSNKGDYLVECYRLVIPAT